MNDFEQSQDITKILNQWTDGDRDALEELMPLVWDELRRLAVNYMRGERQDHTLQPTALLNEVYLRLIDSRQIEWQSRSHFFAIAARLMRRILVDHARRTAAQKRGDPTVAVSLDAALDIATGREPELLALDEALKSLAKLDQRQSQIVELRYFAGLTVNEIAATLEISRATVVRQWRMAKAWLFRHLQEQDSV